VVGIQGQAVLEAEGLDGDLEGALLLLAVMALQLLVDPTADWTRGLPPWATRGVPRA